MKARLSATDAWRAISAGDEAGAERIWLKLLAQDEQSSARIETHLGYLRLLMRQQRTLEACAVLQKLFDLSGDSCFLKLLGELALEQPSTQASRVPVQPALSPEQYGLAARQSHSQARFWLEQGDWPQALFYAKAGLRQARGSHQPELELQAHWLMADLMIARQDLSKARVCYQAAERIWAQLPK